MPKIPEVAKMPKIEARLRRHFQELALNGLRQIINPFSN